MAQWKKPFRELETSAESLSVNKAPLQQINPSKP